MESSDIESSVLQRVSAPVLQEFGLVCAYDKWAKTYDKDMVCRLGYTADSQVADVLCEMVPPEKRSEFRLLDAGAGTGLLGQTLKKRGFTNLDALDPSAQMLEEARKKNVYKNFFCEMLTEDELNIEEGSYDLVVGLGMLGADYAPFSAMREMARLSKPGGHVIVSLRQCLIERKDYQEMIPIMNSLESEGTWKKVEELVLPNYWKDTDGVLYKFQVL